MLNFVWLCESCGHVQEGVSPDAEPGQCPTCEAKLTRKQSFVMDELINNVEKAAEKCAAFAPRFLDEFAAGPEALCASGLLFLGLCKGANVNPLQFARYLLELGFTRPCEPTSPAPS